MKKTGFYIIYDKFFEDMSDPYLKNCPPRSSNNEAARKVIIGLE